MKIFYRDQEYDLGPMARAEFFKDSIEIEHCTLEPEDQERLLTQWRQAADHPPVRLIWEQPGHGPVMVRARLIQIVVDEFVALQFHVHQHLSM